MDRDAVVRRLRERLPTLLAVYAFGSRIRGDARPDNEALLAEYRSVLVRPRLRELHGLTVAEVDAVLTDLVQHAIVMTPVAAPPAPDPGDRHLWELLAAKDDLLLVTGDKLRLRDRALQGRVVSPTAFLAPDVDPIQPAT